MINKAKLALIGAVVAVLFASPAFSIANREPAEQCCSAACFRPANGTDFSEFASTPRFRPRWCRDFPGPCGKLRP